MSVLSSLEYGVLFRSSKERTKYVTGWLVFARCTFTSVPVLDKLADGCRRLPGKDSQVVLHYKRREAGALVLVVCGETQRPQAPSSANF